MVIRLEELDKRIEKIEQQNNLEILTMVEILSTATFFGKMKKASCKRAINGQCSYFIINIQEKNKIPIITQCRIDGCKEQTAHCHLETSNITCSLCHKQKYERSSKIITKKRTSQIKKNQPSEQ
jgi:hypothetical protein